MTSPAHPTVTLGLGAARRLHDLSIAEGRPLMLRVSVEGGGCSGFSYVFDLVEAAEPDDTRVERDGVAMLVDDVSLPFLADAEVDYVDELVGAQFKVRNPNAASSCGCGVSFSI